MPALCFGALPVAAGVFTLVWTHSVEHVRWAEDWRIDAGGRLQLVEARISGSAAGMEPPAEARLEGGLWHYRPSLPPQPELWLTRSPFVADYTLCDATGCTALGARLPAGAGEVVRLQPCPGAADNGGG